MARPSTIRRLGRVAVRGLAVVALFLLLEAFLLAWLPPDDLLGGELGQVQSLHNPEIDPWRYVIQFTDLDSLVLPAGYELELEPFDLGHTDVVAAGRVVLPQGSPGAVLYLDLCAPGEGRQSRLRLSARPDVRSELQIGGRIRVVPAPLSGNRAAWQVGLTTRGGQAILEVNGQTLARVHCAEPGARLWTTPQFGSALLQDWRLAWGEAEWRQGWLSKLVHPLVSLLLAVALVLGLRRVRARALLSGIVRSARRALTGAVLLVARLARPGPSRVGLATLVLLVPPLLVMLSSPGAQRWTGETRADAVARPGYPVRLDRGLPADLELQARSLSQPGAECWLAFRHVRAPHMASLSDRSVEYNSWQALPLGPGAIALSVRAGRAELRIDGQVQSEAQDLEILRGAVWLVSRQGSCHLEDLRLDCGVPAAASRYAAPLLWWFGLLGSLGLLLFLGATRSVALSTMLAAATLGSLGLLAAEALLGPLAWTALALVPGACLVAGRPLLRGRRRFWGGALLLLCAVILVDLGLGGLPALQRVRLGARIPQHEFLLHHTPIGALGWNAFVRAHPLGGYTYGPAEPGQTRVLCLGGSSTAGTGASDREHSFPAVLQQRLRGAWPDRSVQVINAGESSYTSLQVRLLVETEMADLDPGLVVINVGHNDCENDFQPGDRFRAKGREPSTLSRVLARSSLWLLFRDLVLTGYRWVSAVGNAVGSSPRIAPEIFRNNLEAVIEEGLAGGRRVVLVVEPRVQRFLGPGGDRCASYVEVLRDLASRYSLILVDPAAGWSPAQASGFFVDDVHLNDAGYSALADDVARAILGHTTP